ncbi:MAG: hypothetical protein M1818_001933 [Claussenomyces sp. TS43310]|nr:MAG: hypothetical protein M1818_001933 [Claussenomyces sp. TS43310]
MTPSKKVAAAECISDEALLHLKSYKYSSVDESPVSNYILKHYWNGVVKLLPLWLAPNMVTLLGFFCILANVLLLVLYVPDMDGTEPSWIYYSFGLGLWMYSTMDNVDGKQARRTGTSSGLGELFDHGIDSLNCTLASLCETAAVGLGCSHAGVFTALVPCLPMFFSTWETYHTHTLYLGFINGPTEGLILACSAMFVAGYYGPIIYTYPFGETWLSSYLIGPLSFLRAYNFQQIWVPVILFSLVFTQMPSCVHHVVQARRRNNLPILPVFLEWTPLVVFTAATSAWIYSPHSTLMRENHLVLLCLTLSFVFGRMTTKIILAHLTRQPFPYWTVMLWPLIGGAVLANLPLLGLHAVSAQVELWYLRGYLVFACVAYFRWAYLVIDSICSFLDINCLTIPYEKQMENQRAAEAARSNGKVTVEMQNGGKRVD